LKKKEMCVHTHIFMYKKLIVKFRLMLVLKTIFVFIYSGVFEQDDIFAVDAIFFFFFIFAPKKKQFHDIINKVWRSLRFISWLCKKKHFVKIWTKTKQIKNKVLKLRALSLFYLSEKNEKNCRIFQFLLFFSLKQRL